jgi:aromatic-L-amino-acid/L-tryptophan decarboxylase
MNSLKISHEELSHLTQQAVALALSYRVSVDERPAYPATSGEQTAKLFFTALAGRWARARGAR